MTQNNFLNKGHKNKDSIETCTSTTDLYYSLRHPQAVRAAKEPLIKEACLKSEARKQLKEGSHFFSHPGFQPVVKTNKMLFMTLVLPPYLIFFFLPKLLCTELVRLIRFSGNFLYRPVHSAVNQVITRYAALKKRWTKQKSRQHTLMNRLKVYLALPKQVISASKQRVLYPFQQVHKLVNKVVSLLLNHVRKRALTVKNGVSAGVYQVKSFCLHQLRKLADLVDKYLIKPCQRLFLPPLQLLRQYCRTYRKMLGDPLARLKKQLVYYFKNPKMLVAQLNKMRKNLWARGLKRLRVYWQLFAEIKQKIKKTASLLKIKCRLGPKQNLTAQKHVNRFGSLGLQVKAMLKVPSWSKPNQIFGAAIRQLKGLNSVNRHYALYMQKMIKGLSFSRFAVTPYMKAKRSVITQLFMHAEKCIKSLGILRGHSVTSQIQKKMFKVTGLAQQFNHLSRLTFAWISVLMSHGMQLVREASERLTPAKASEYKVK